MSETNSQVLKVGGSLVTQPDFVAALRAWLKAQQRTDPARHFVLLVGGGVLVDGLRQLDLTHPMSEEIVHWHAIDLMESLGRIVGGWLPEIEITSDFVVAQEKCRQPGVTLLLATDFLRQVEPSLPGNPLPAGWHVTSDSIAARVAIGLDAGTLTLLKSMSADPATVGGDWRRAAEVGLVDSFFPEAVRGIPQVKWATLPSMGEPTRVCDSKPNS